MRKSLFIAIAFIATTIKCVTAQQPVSLVTTDINNFWQAYDKIIATKDSVEKYDYLNKLFIEKATLGQKAMIQARNYTPKSYIDAITQRQTYFNSIRNNTFKANDYAAAIDKKIEILKKFYPVLRPAKIYFTVGAFRSGGTTLDSMVLIGSEIAMADEHLGNLVFTNIHEYVHTQQRATICDNLLGQSVMEGVAEFITEKVMLTRSTIPAFAYGKQNVEKVKQAFAKQMYNTGNGFWLYSDVENEFGVRDLGYYVGYAITEAYYNKAKDKVKAIKEMIELDYNDQVALSSFVNQSGYFSKSVQVLNEEYEKGRPTVLSVFPFEDGKLINPSTTKFTINFSTALDKRYRNFELGPLGKDYLLKLKNFVGFSADGKSAEFEMELRSNQHYQILIGGGFRDANGIRLKPYLIDFKTIEK